MRKFLGSVALAAAFVLGGLFGALPAKANTYDFSFVGLGGTAVFNGEITTDAFDVATSLSGNVIDPGFSGPITALIPTGTAPYTSTYGWDNIVNAASPYFSATQTSGLLFLFGGGTIGNLYYQPNNSTFYLSLSAPDGLYNPGDPGLFTLAQTPLPSTWTMLIAAFAGFGFLAYRGTKKSSALAAA